MCPKCSPQNFCRDAEHGHSEESPAHKSACKKCSFEYFERQGMRSVDDRDLERSLRRRRAENEQLQLEAENVRLQIQIHEERLRLAALQAQHTEQLV